LPYTATITIDFFDCFRTISRNSFSSTTF
jgi:hypothetical protein